MFNLQLMKNGTRKGHQKHIFHDKSPDMIYDEILSVSIHVKQFRASSSIVRFAGSTKIRKNREKTNQCKENRIRNKYRTDAYCKNTG